MRKKITISGFVIFAGTAVWLGLSMTSTAGNDALELAWSAETGKAISLAPVAVGNRVVVVSNNNRTIAFAASSGGKMLWQYKPKEGVWDWGLASDARRVFVCLKGAGLAALNSTNGALLWKIDLGIDCQRPPLLSGGYLYVPTTFVGPGLKGTPLSGAKLFSINPANGQVNWVFSSDNYILQTPYRQAGTVYVGGSYIDPNVKLDEGGVSRFYALNSKTGQEKWKYESQDGFVKALYATKERLVFVGYPDYLNALDTANGKLVWKRDTGNWVPSLSGKDGVVFYGAANTKIHAWDVLNGKTRWEISMPGKASFNYLMGKPVFAADRLYFMNQKGTVYALNRKDGKILWSHKTKTTSRTGLSISGNLLFIGSTSGRISAYNILK